MPRRPARGQRGALLGAIVAFVLAMPASADHGGAAHSWTYGGAHGPTHWSELDPEFSVCKTGHFQSPIDIRGATPADLPPITFDYHDSPLKIVNNGHTIMVTPTAGSSISIGGKRYELVQFHFHHPSEEKVGGKQYDMVVHLVHKDSDGHLAVVGVLLKAGKADNALIDKLWAHLPKKPDEENTVAPLLINADQLLPAQHGYYTFPGSLTTPPCSEGVTWYVLKEPVTISAKQVAQFAKIYPNNARPLQAIADRPLQQTR